MAAQTLAQVRRQLHVAEEDQAELVKEGVEDAIE
jgi:hypothetical protein